MVDPRLYSLIKIVETGSYTKAAEQPIKSPWR